MTKRDKLLNELSKYKTVPGHGLDINELSDEKLESRLRILKVCFNEYFSDNYKDDDLME